MNKIKLRASYVAVVAASLSSITSAQTNMLEEVVVTAQKREQSIVDVPTSITALGADSIAKTRAKSLGDMQQLAPNFSFDSVNGYENINIRGVGGGGRNIGFDTRAGLYIDGVYIGQSAALAQPLFDIARVEVLRGPQGHLFGRNTVSGAISLVSAPPADEFAGSVRAVVANYDAVEVYGTVEGPLSDRVAAKLSLAHEERDGFVDNNANGDTLDDLERDTFRGALRFDVSDDLSIDFFADYSKTERAQIVGEAQTDFFGVITDDYPASAYSGNFNTTPRSDADIGGISMTMNYTLAGGQTITSVSAYRYAEQLRVNDTDYSAADIFSISFVDTSKQFSQEIRIASDGEESVRYVAGLYFLSEESESVRHATVGQDVDTEVPLPVPGAFAPFGVAFGVDAGADTIIDAGVDTRSYAAFAAVDIDITDTLTLNLGGRYSKDTKDVRYSLDGSQSGGLGLATLLGFEDDVSDGKFTPTVGFTWALSDASNAYFKYATGFKSSGINIDFLSEAGTRDFGFDSESVESYELGIKGTLLDGRIQYDAAIYQANYEDFQILQFVDLGAGVTTIALRNAAEVESRGFEGSFKFALTDQVALGANLGLLNAEFTSFPNAGGAGIDYDGNELPNSPDLTGAVTLDYWQPVEAWQGAFDVYFEYSYRSESHAQAGNVDATEKLDQRGIVNAKLSFTPDSEQWQVSLWARNLLDEDYVSFRARDFLGHEILTRGEPQTFGAEFSWNF